MSGQDKDGRDTDRERRDGDKPTSSAPDAVKDPNEKTDGKPGAPGQGDETDPGAG